MEYHSRKVDNLFQELQTSSQGLSSAEAEKRLQQYGLNEITLEKKDSLLKIFMRQFRSMIVLILVFAIGIALMIGEFLDAAIISIILFLNAILGFVQEYRSEKAIESLKKLTEAQTTVLRDGKEVKVASHLVVPGDVVHLREGDKVPADCRLLECSGLETQEASLTGESTPVSKEVSVLAEKVILPERKNLVYAGTSVTKGKAVALVVMTAMGTEVGKIAGMLQAIKPEPTHLQKKLGSLGRLLGVMAVLVGALVFVLGLLKGGSMSVLLLTAIAIAVAAIPEGLPAVITIALALGVQRMAKRNALVRRLPSVETLGSTTVICTDKTGTLTQNKMEVQKVYADLQEMSIGAVDSKNILFDIAVLCNNATESFGDPTEVALLELAKKRNVQKKGLDEEFPRLDEVAFSSELKYMATQHKVKGRKVWYVKGAVDVLVDKCVGVLAEGKVKRMAPKLRDEILGANERMASNALRVLAFAYGNLDQLVFVGLVGMMDPPRDEVKDAIQRCKDAGIKVVMITGDHLITARAVASLIGLEGKAVSGKDLEEMRLEEEVENIGIYARVNPEHKLRIVDALKKKGHVVAMTGDGVNDAPALKKADIGIAMGITGTEVAKEASAMVLADDHFATIVRAVEEGRGIYDNIKKFVLFLITSNITEVMVLLSAAILGLPLPLLAIHILWVNLITDGLPALALGVDPISEDVMRLKPRIPKARILNKLDVFRVTLLSAFITLLIVTMFKQNLVFGLVAAQSMVFTALVILELFVAFLVRIPYRLRLFSNAYLWFSVLGSFALQLLVLYTPLAKVFKVAPLTGLQWVYILVACFGVWVVGYIINRFFSRRGILEQGQ
ncbi:cation-translocating P-type ATPase [Candidatus Woesearchaeota archaeon]|nr:cation-translocating P-type ATPase [Candidatus Woesearchaeota archaeon]